jgi:hypothetical protein
VHNRINGVKLSKNTLKYYIPEEKNALFTPHIFSDTQKYSLHFECLAGQENGLIHALKEKIPGHPDCI